MVPFWGSVWVVSCLSCRLPRGHGISTDTVQSRPNCAWHPWQGSDVAACRLLAGIMAPQETMTILCIAGGIVDDRSRVRVTRIHCWLISKPGIPRRLIAGVLRQFTRLSEISSSTYDATHLIWPLLALESLRCRSRARQEEQKLEACCSTQLIPVQVKHPGLLDLMSGASSNKK